MPRYRVVFELYASTSTEVEAADADAAVAAARATTHRPPCCPTCRQELEIDEDVYATRWDAEEDQ